MRRSISFVSLLAITTLPAFSSWLPTDRVASAGQGKGGEVVAKPTPAPAPKKTTTRTRTSSRSTGSKTGVDELAFWETIKNSTDPEDFKAYLEQYPKGKFASLAKNRLKTLEGMNSSSKPSTTNPGSRNPNPTNSSSSNLPRMRTNQAGIEFVLIPPGSFMMGSTNGSENPVHQVMISQPFYIGRYEVTQAQWQAVMGNNPSDFKNCGGNCPVEQVSWNDAQEFIQKLNQMNDGYLYRLPSEAEWEYACRAGTTTAFAFGDSLSSDQANFDGNYPYGGAGKGVYRQKTTAVGSFQPNAFGLFDMHGNVWEWCQDWYHESYNGAPSDGSAWLSGGEQKYRVLRGGSWNYYGVSLRSASRSTLSPDYRDSYVGFRVVANARTQ